MISCCRTLRVIRPQLLLFRYNAQSSRVFSSVESPSQPKTADYVEFANAMISQHPVECLASVIVLEYVAFNGGLQVIRLSGLQLGPELAIAFAATRGLKPVLLPVKVAAAALTARMVPVLGRFQLTGVVTALSQWRQAASQRVADMLGKLRPVILDPTSANSKQPSALSKPLTGVRRVIDKYGVAYMIGSRVVGVAAMAGLYVALTSGLDVSGMIEAQGWKSAGDVAGDWAAAFMVSGLLFPAGLYCAPFLAKGLSRWKSVLLKQ